MPFDRKAYIRDRSEIFFSLDESMFDPIGYVGGRTKALEADGKTAEEAVEIARSELEDAEVAHRREAALAKAALFADRQAWAQRDSDVHEAAEKARLAAKITPIP